MKLSAPSPFTLFPKLKIWLRMPAFTGWLSLSTGIALAELFPALKVPSLYNLSVSYAILLFLLPALLCKKSPLRMVSFFLFGYLLFTNHLNKEYTFYSQLDTILANNNKTFLSGKVISAPLYTKGNYSFLCAVDRLFTDRDTFNLHRKTVTCKSRHAPPSYGTIHCKGKYRAPSRPANPYAFNEYSYLSANRIWGKFSIDTLITVSPANSFFASCAQFVRKTVYKTISHVHDKALQGILQAAFLGEKNNLTPEIKSIFREAGIYHLLAISGLHVAILISSILLILAAVPTSRTVKIIMTVLFIWCYLFFIGIIPSLFRAVIMATLILLSSLFQRNNHIINSLGIAGILWLSMSPASLFTAGYQLSFAATFGIITLFPVFNAHGIPLLSNAVLSLSVKTLLTPFFVSLAGFIATAPVLIYHFGRISLFGLIANIFAVALMGLAMNTFFVGIAAQMLLEPVSIIVMKVTQFFLSLMTGIAKSSQLFPLASLDIPVPPLAFYISYCFIFTGLAAVDKKYLLRYIYWILPCMFLAAPLILLCHSLPKYSEVIFFSTKQQSLTGIRFSNKKIWLVGSLSAESSGQTYKYAVKPWLRHFFIKEYDAVLQTTAGRNMVHTLDPFITEIRPNIVISCNEIPDKLLEEDFNSFLNDYGIHNIKAGTGWRFIPAPQCTCTIYRRDKSDVWYKKNEPAAILLSFNGTHISINGSGYNYSDKNSGNSIHINNARVYCHNSELSGSLADTFIKKDFKRRFSTKTDGAVRLRINRKGRVKVTTMSDSGGG